MSARRQQDKEQLFTQFYKEYADRIINYILFMVKNKDNAEEIAQEAFVRAYRNIDRYDEEKARLSTWVYTIARNLAYNFLKHKKYEPGVSIHEQVKVGNDKMELLKLLPDEKELGAQKMLELKELKEAVRNAIKLLPTQYREVIMLCDIHQMPHLEVALLLKCSINTVDVRLTRARRKLVQIMKSPNETEEK